MARNWADYTTELGQAHARAAELEARAEELAEALRMIGMAERGADLAAVREYAYDVFTRYREDSAFPERFDLMFGEDVDAADELAAALADLIRRYRLNGEGLKDRWLDEANAALTRYREDSDG